MMVDRIVRTRRSRAVEAVTQAVIGGQVTQLGIEYENKRLGHVQDPAQLLGQIRGRVQKLFHIAEHE